MKKLSKFATEMRVARVRAGKSQKDFAKDIGVSQGYICYIETGGCNPPKWILEGYKLFLKREGLGTALTEELLLNHRSYVIAKKNIRFK